MEYFKRKKTAVKPDICDLEECKYELLKGQNKFCTLHICFVSGCQDKRRKSPNNNRHPYCQNHSCDDSMCSLPVSNIGYEGKQCIKHKCHVNNCHKTNQTNKYYCLNHTCKYKDCSKLVIDKCDFCENHGCKECNEPLDELDKNQKCAQCTLGLKKIITDLDFIPIKVDDLDSNDDLDDSTSNNEESSDGE